MRDYKKLGRNLLVFGITLILITPLLFFNANQKDKEAEIIRQTNEVRADVRKSNANFNRTIAFIMLAGGTLSIIFGLHTRRKM